MKRTIIFGLLLLMVVFVTADVDWDNEPYATYGTPLTIAQYQTLTDEDLSDWDIEYRGYEEQNQDFIYYFYMNTYFLQIEYDEFDNEELWIIPVRETRYIGCYERDDCDDFYLEELNLTVENEFQYLKDMQDEL